MKTEKKLEKIIKKALAKRSPNIIEDKDSVYLHAAVLIPLYRYENEYRLLFTKRTNSVEHHKGQISFPGGAVDEEDKTLEDTALREASEEIGLLPEDVTLLGRIDDTLTVVSNFVVHPIIGMIPYPYDFKINRGEVKRLIEVPLQVFMVDNPKDRIHDVEYGGATYASVAYPYGDDIIWGATARIMENFMEILGKDLASYTLQ